MPDRDRRQSLTPFHLEKRMPPFPREAANLCRVTRSRSMSRFLSIFRLCLLLAGSGVHDAAAARSPVVPAPAFEAMVIRLALGERPEPAAPVLKGPRILLEQVYEHAMRATVQVLTAR